VLARVGGLRSAAQGFKMSLFSPLLCKLAGLMGQKRCPNKGLSAKSQVIYQDFLRFGAAATPLPEQFRPHF
jgi:hypothetical protein